MDTDRERVQKCTLTEVRTEIITRILGLQAMFGTQKLSVPENGCQEGYRVSTGGLNLRVYSVTVRMEQEPGIFGGGSGRNSKWFIG